MAPDGPQESLLALVQRLSPSASASPDPSPEVALQLFAAAWRLGWPPSGLGWGGGVASGTYVDGIAILEPPCSS